MPVDAASDLQALGVDGPALPIETLDREGPPAASAAVNYRSLIAMSGHGMHGSMSDVQSVAHQLPREVARYLQCSSADATRRAYLGDVSDFARWGGRVPCTAMMLAQYIAARAQVHKPSTIARRVVGIGRAHVAGGYQDPSKDDLVRAVLRGVRRTHGTTQRRAAPLLVEDLRGVLKGLPGDLLGVRNRALLLLGFAGGMRRSELVRLDVDDLLFSQGGLQVCLRSSKTDQERVGRVIAIPSSSSALCPVAALRAWLEAARIDAGPVFRAVCGKGVSGQRLSDQSVSLIVKQQMALLGKSAVDYSGHSLRAGFVTSAAQAGIGLLMIQQQTGHRNLAMLTRYVRPSNPFDGNAAGALL